MDNLILPVTPPSQLFDPHRRLWQFTVVHFTRERECTRVHNYARGERESVYVFTRFSLVKGFTLSFGPKVGSTD